MTSVKLTFQTTYRIEANRSRDRIDAGVMVLLAVLAATAAIGVAAAMLMVRHNEARLVRYRTDAICAGPMTRIPTPSASGACLVDSARIVSRWVNHASGRSYRMALATSDGFVDSVEIHDGDPRVIWETPARAALVQRFVESPTAPNPHVTAVNIGGKVARTDWNPAWQTDDANAGAIVCLLLAVGCLIWRRRIGKRRRLRFS